MVFSSLIVTIARDPGPITPLETLEEDLAFGEGGGEPAEDTALPDDENMTLAEALLSSSQASTTRHDSTDDLVPVKSNGEKRWCRKCWAPKPERAHHCSDCDRCVLKMGKLYFGT